MYFFPHFSPFFLEMKDSVLKLHSYAENTEILKNLKISIKHYNSVLKMFELFL